MLCAAWYGVRFKVDALVMAATLNKTCPSCREQHFFFLPMGNAAEPTRQYEYTCPRNRQRVRFQAVKTDPWKKVEDKPPGTVIVREVLARA
jgi:hypothetical protein